MRTSVERNDFEYFDNLFFAVIKCVNDGRFSLFLSLKNPSVNSF